MSRLEKRKTDSSWEQKHAPETLEAAEQEFLEELDAQINELQVREGLGLTGVICMTDDSSGCLPG